MDIVEGPYYRPRGFRRARFALAPVAGEPLGVDSCRGPQSNPDEPGKSGKPRKTDKGGKHKAGTRPV